MRRKENERVIFLFFKFTHDNSLNWLNILADLYREYNTIVDQSGAGRTRLEDHARNPVHFLRRPEFLAESAQNVYQSAQSGLKVDYEAYSSIAIFCESPHFDYEATKTLLMLRRDLAMKLTHSSIFVFDVIHSRGLYRSGCVTGNIGLIGALTCEDTDCRQRGGCHAHFSSVTVNACNK